MKITLNFKDVKKLIEESYTGINEVKLEKEKDFDILLDVDGDTFSRKKTNQTIKGSTIDYDKILEEKAKLKSEITGEPHTPPSKTIEEINEEARQKGLMVSGRGSERVLKKF